jgi:hypothetical protein
VEWTLLWIDRSGAGVRANRALFGKPGRNVIDFERSESQFRRLMPGSRVRLAGGVALRDNRAAARWAGGGEPARADSFGSPPLAEVVGDDVRVTNRVSTLISAFGVLASTVLLAGAVREYRSGASALWIAAGAAILLSALYALVRDVRRLRTGQAT